MRSILITAWNRPRYLYVTLTSVYKMKGIEDWEVVLIIDRTDNPGDTETILAMMSSFPIDRTYIASRKRGNLDSLICGISFEFSRGAEEVIFIEDDFLLRSDLLKYLDTVVRKDFLISFSGAYSKSIIHYRPRGNLITRENFPELCEWIMSRKYVGEKRSATKNQILDMKSFGHDAIFSVFVEKYSKYVSFPAQFYVGDFGIVGMNSPEVKATDETLEIQSRMFSGPKYSWMDNVANLMKIQAHERFWPPEFIYR